MDLLFQQLDPLQLPLVNRFYKECRYPAKAGRGEKVFVLKAGTSIVAAVRLSPKADNTLFLRSMCVAPDSRRLGYGARLLQGIEPVLAQQSSYCFPFEHLLSFYERAHYQVQTPESVPSFIRDPFENYRRQGRNIIIMTRGSMP